MKTNIKRFLSGCLAAVMLLSTGAFAAEPQKGEERELVPEDYLAEPAPVCTPPVIDIPPDIPEDTASEEPGAASNSIPNADPTEAESPETGGVPMVAAALEDSVVPMADAAPAADTETVPELSADGKYLFANGVPITITGNNKVTYNGTELPNAIDTGTLVYGGSKSGNVASTSVTLDGGTVAWIIGGCLVGDVTGTAEVVINSGTVSGGIVGGSYNSGSAAKTSVIVNSGTVGSIYGGGDSASTSTAEANVTINGGTISKNVYAGGYSGSTTNANLTINDGTIGSGAEGGGTTNLGAAFGGGYAGSVGNSHVNIDGGSIPLVYGGNHHTKTDQSTVNIAVNGGNILTVQGGGFTGAGRNTINIAVSGSSGKAARIKQLVLGEAKDQTSNSTVTYTMSGGRVDDLFSGANASLSCKVLGGNIVYEHVTSSTMKFYGADGNPVYKVRVMNHETESDDLSLLDRTTRASDKALDIQVTTKGTTWYSSLDETGKLNVYLPQGTLNKDDLVVGIKRSDGIVSFGNKGNNPVSPDYTQNATNVYGRDAAAVTFRPKGGTGGDVSISPSSNSGAGVTIGTSVTFTARADNGYVMDSWWINGEPAASYPSANVESNGTLTLTVQDDVTVEALFVKKGEVKFGGSLKKGSTNRSCVVTAAPAGESSVSSTASDLGTLSSVAKGTDVTFSYSISDSDYKFVAWREAAAGTEALGAELSTDASFVWTSEGDAKLIIAECVTKKDLQAAYDEATPMYDSHFTAQTGGDYHGTADSITAFNKAYLAARDKLAEAAAHQSDIDAAETALRDAMKAISCMVKLKVPDNLEGGRFEIVGESDYFLKDNTVQIKPVPAAGYSYNLDSSTPANPNFPLTVGSNVNDFHWDSGKGCYTFTMPSSVVTVTAEAEKDHFVTEGYTVSYSVLNSEGNKPNGAISASIDGTAQTTPISSVNINQTIVFTATPEDHFKVAKWEIKPEGGTAKDVTDQATGDGKTTLTLDNVNANTTVNVTFERCKYKINIDNKASTTLGNITVKTDDGTAISENESYYGFAGKNITVNVAKKDGKDSQLSLTYTKTEDNQIKPFTIEPDGEGKYIFTMPDEDTTVTALFDELYTITVDPAITTGGGQVTFKVDGVSPTDTTKIQARKGQTVIVTPTKPGYTAEKVYWTGAGTSGNSEVPFVKNQYQFEMPGQNVTISVVFEPIKYKISTEVVKADGSTGTPPFGTIEVSERGATDATIEFTVNLAPGYTLITENATDKPVVVEATVTGENPITLNSPATGSDKYSFEMPNSDVKITAKVTEESYNIKSKVFAVKEGTTTEVEKTDFGTVKIGETAITSMPASPQKFNSTVSFTVEAKPGYAVKTVKAVTGEGENKEDVPVTGPVADGKTYTLTMPAGEVEIQAEFEADKYAVTVDPSMSNIDTNNGGISLPAEPDPYEVKYTAPDIGVDAQIVVTASPKEHYVLKSITLTPTTGNPTIYSIETTTETETAKKLPAPAAVEGQERTYNYTLQYKMPACDVKVTAVFTEDLRTVTVDPGTLGTITLAKAPATAGGTPTTIYPTVANGNVYEIQTGTNLLITVEGKGEAGDQLANLTIEEGDGETPAKTILDPWNKDDPHYENWTDESYGVSDGDGDAQWHWVDKHVYKYTVSEDVKITAGYRQPADRTYNLDDKLVFPEDKTNMGSVTLYKDTNVSGNEITGPIAKDTTVVVIPEKTDSSEVAGVEYWIMDSGKTNYVGKVGNDHNDAGGNEYSFKMPAGYVTVRVEFKVKPNPDDNTVTDPNHPPVVTTSTYGTQMIAACSSKGITETVKNVTPEDPIVKLNVNTVSGNKAEGITSTTFQIPAEAVTTLANSENVGGLELTGQANESGQAPALTLDDTALKAVKESLTAGGTGKNVEIVLEKVTEVPNLSEEDKAGLKDTVYSFEVKVDGQKVPTFNNGEITLRIPYELAEGETADSLKGCYIADKGKVQILLDSDYDAATGEMVIHTKHLSSYGLVCIENKFKDLEGHWAKSYVLPMSAMGLVKGTGKNSFSPDTPLTRGMMVTILGRWAGADESPVSDTGFSDVATDRYYAPYVAWAKEAGVVNGTGKDTFSPEDPITRQELAVIMYRYARMQGKLELSASAPDKPFADKASISSWAGDAVNALYNAKIINGKGADCFAPLDKASRAEVCTMLSRFIKLVETAQ